MADEFDKEIKILNEEYEGTPISSYSKVFMKFNEGEIISGVVTKIENDRVILDLGGKTEGYIPREELSDKEFSSPEEIVKLDDKLQAYILRIEDKTGELVLSKKRADYEFSWDKVRKIYEKNEIAIFSISKAVKGGLIVNVFSLCGFVPSSQIELYHVEELSSYEGKELEFKIVEINKEENKIILSRKIVLEEELKRKKKELLEKIKEGEIREGIVTKITDFGVFVNLGGLSGLVHISEMSWIRIPHPSDVVKEGDKVKVMVLKVDRENEKISLGMKQAQPNPWLEVDKKYPVGKIVDAEVMRIFNFGVFVKLDENIEGLIRPQELTDEKINFPEEVVKVGDKVRALIINLNKEEKKIYLSLKQAREREDYIKYLKRDVKEEEIKKEIPQQIIQEVNELQEVKEEIKEEVKEEKKELIEQKETYCEEINFRDILGKLE